MSDTRLFQQSYSRRRLLRFGTQGACAALLAPKLFAAQTRLPISEEERMRWWEDARFGLFLHWGLYSVAAGEWKGEPVPGAEHLMLYERIPWKEYASLAKGLTLDHYNPDVWVRAAKDAGMKYIVITAKHHEGFAMYDSPSNDYNIVKDSPYGRDPMKLLAKACHRHGIRLCFYYSLGRDWQDPDVPTNWPVKGGRSNTWDFPDEDHKQFALYFKRKVMPQVRELLSQYGPVGVLWFDTPELINREQSAQLKALIRTLQPACIVNSRIGNDFGDFKVAEQSLHAPATKGPWEACMTMSKNWGYVKADKAYKSPEVLIRDLIDVVSAGGNFLLDTGPTPQGTLTPQALESMKQIGSWMSINGEAIYGSTPWNNHEPAPSLTQPAANASSAVGKDAVNDATPTNTPADLRFTSKNGFIYLFVRNWKMPVVTTQSFDQQKLEVAQVTLLGSSKPILWQKQQGSLQITLPNSLPSEIPIYVFRIRLASKNTQ